MKKVIFKDPHSKLFPESSNILTIFAGFFHCLHSSTPFLVLRLVKLVPETSWLCFGLFAVTYFIVMQSSYLQPFKKNYDFKRFKIIFCYQQSALFQGSQISSNTGGEGFFYDWCISKQRVKMLKCHYGIKCMKTCQNDINTLVCKQQCNYLNHTVCFTTLCIQTNLQFIPWYV